MNYASVMSSCGACKGCASGCGSGPPITPAPDGRPRVIWDGDCTFCRRLHAKIDQYMEQGIEIRYFLYPRNGPTSASWAKAENVWCANDRNEALTLAKLDEEYPTHTCDASIVSTPG